MRYEEKSKKKKKGRFETGVWAAGSGRVYGIVCVSLIFL